MLMLNSHDFHPSLAGLIQRYNDALIAYEAPDSADLEYLALEAARVALEPHLTNL